MKDIISNIIKFFIEGNGMELISAFIGLLGVYWTIQYTRNQFNDDKRKGIKPYLDLSIAKMKFISKHSFTTGEEIEKFSDDDVFLLHIKEDSLQEGSIGTFNINFKLENVGLENAINCKVIDIIGEDRDWKYFKENRSIIKKGESQDIFIKIEKTITDEHIKLSEENEYLMENLEKGDYHIDIDKYPYGKFISDCISKVNKEKVYIKVEYYDLLNNRYIKSFCVKLYLFGSIDGYFRGRLIEGGLKILIEEHKETLIINNKSSV